MRAAAVEDLVDRAPKRASLERKGSGDEYEVDEILGACALPPAFVDARVGVEFLGDMCREWQERDDDRCDAGEVEQTRRDDHVDGLERVVASRARRRS